MTRTSRTVSFAFWLCVAFALTSCTLPNVFRTRGDGGADVDADGMSVDVPPPDGAPDADVSTDALDAVDTPGELPDVALPLDVSEAGDVADVVDVRMDAPVDTPVDTPADVPVDACSLCTAGQMCCSGACFDTSSSTTHCGACGNSCAAGEVCVASVCEPRIVQLALGHESSFAVREDGVLFAWGRNASGQLGDGSTTNRLTPARVSALTRISQVATNRNMTCARVSAGAVYCWGTPVYSLGDGSMMVASPTPVAVSGISNAVQIAVGEQHACARLATGAVMCWGGGSQGQLGTASTNASTPVAVTGIMGATDLSAGRWHNCATLADGTVRCWGFGANGELGNGGMMSSLAPVTPTGLMGVAALSVGANHSCARVGAGSIYCWGANNFGQLGNGPGSGSLLPASITSVPLSRPSSLSSSWGHTCVVSGGMSYCWGQSGNGEIGDGTGMPRTVPTAASVLTDVVSVAAGGSHTCAIRANNRIACWGANGMGQIGDGMTSPRLSPTTLAALPR